MPDIEPHPLVETLTALFCREGSPFAKADRDVIRVRLGWEWASGQWVMVTGPEDVLWGWASWFRTDTLGLSYLRNMRGDDIIALGIPLCLWEGPHAYIASAVVAPWAPRSTYRTLARLVKAANQDADDISTHFHKADGRRVFHIRRKR